MGPNKPEGARNDSGALGEASEIRALAEGRRHRKEGFCDGEVLLGLLPPGIMHGELAGKHFHRDRGGGGGAAFFVEDYAGRHAKEAPDFFAV